MRGPGHNRKYHILIHIYHSTLNQTTMTNYCCFLHPHRDHTFVHITTIMTRISMQQPVGFLQDHFWSSCTPFPSAKSCGLIYITINIEKKRYNSFLFTLATMVMLIEPPKGKTVLLTTERRSF